jgi:hypothetical protein
MRKISQERHLELWEEIAVDFPVSMSIPGYYLNDLPGFGTVALWFDMDEDLFVYDPTGRFLTWGRRIRFRTDADAVLFKMMRKD